MKVTNIIQDIASKYVDASKHHLASIAEVIDQGGSRGLSLNSITDSINAHMKDLDKIPGKEFLSKAKYGGAQGELYLITSAELDLVSRLFGRITSLVPVHHTDTLNNNVSALQDVFTEIKKD